MNYPQIMSPVSFTSKTKVMGVMSPSSYGSAAHVSDRAGNIHNFVYQ